jgi:adenine-specific DNA methylase
MAYRLLLITVLLLAFANPAVANWWIVRAADGKCLVVDVEPSGNDVAKVGKDIYQTQQQAESKVKTLCKEDRLPRAPGNAE